MSTRATPLLWRRPSPANDNPAPLSKRLGRLFRLVVLIGILCGLIWSAITFG